MPTILKKKGSKKGKRSYKRKGKKTSLAGKVSKLTRQVKSLQKTAAPEWLTQYLPSDFDYEFPGTNIEISCDNITAQYLGPQRVGNQTADGSVDHETFMPKYLEIDLSITLDPAWPPPDADGNRMNNHGQWAGNFSQFGSEDWFGNKIRVIIGREKENSFTSYDSNLPPSILNVLYTNEQRTGTVNFDYHRALVRADYRENTGGRKKDHWILYDEIIDMTKMGQTMDSAIAYFNDTTQGFIGNPTQVTTAVNAAVTQKYLVGTYTQKIKLDLKSCGPSKIMSYDNTNNKIISYDYGGFYMWIVSDKLGSTSSTYSGIGPTWYASYTGRFVFTSK